MSEYNWSNFWDLLREAQSAGEEVDLFDLRVDVVSHKEWALLQQKQAEAATVLSTSS